MQSTVRVLSIESMPIDCQEVLGLVAVSFCYSRSLVGDMLANIKNWTVGGELTGYTTLVDEAMEAAERKLIDKAEQMGAKAVIGIRFSTTQVTHGAAELILYGTAVR
ncbi:hypothetical protein D5085_01510 [Ectothiorhodospiraceae bacterium BW-2]|nr:hypothetical protein D5085_01510 [Ectothiorhodospiraceae bacterium BW-2]